MTLNREKKLLSLSLEFSAAKENLTAVDAFERYLRNRLNPGSLFRKELDAASSELKAFTENEFYRIDGHAIEFVLYLMVPIFFRLENCSAEKFTDEELKTLEQIVRFFREKMETVSQLKGLTYTDDLTGLYNQRYLELVLEREISLSKRNNSIFSVLFLDLDHFKNVNDTHGHLVGSRLLYEVGVEIKKTLRDSDVSFRYGGDEFVMILSHTGLSDAVVVAERIRQQIEKKRFLVRDGMDIRLTASIGVASVPEHAHTKQQILKAADEALYGVKKAVRNRVIAAASAISRD